MKVLCIESWNGKTLVSGYSERKILPEWVRRKVKGGTATVIDLPPEDEELSLDELQKKYVKG